MEKRHGEEQAQENVPAGTRTLGCLQLQGESSEPLVQAPSPAWKKTEPH